MWNRRNNPGPNDPAESGGRREREGREPEPNAGDENVGPLDQPMDPEEIVEHFEKLREQETQLRAEVDDWRTKYQRALADFQNYQRRSVENEREARRQGITSIVSNLLGVLDTFDLALQQDPRAATAEQIAQGVRMIRTQLAQSLASQGVLAIEPRSGDEFDPHRHEAVAHLPAEGIEPGRVAGLLQPGYALNERVLRPAKVSVAKAPEGCAEGGACSCAGPDGDS